MIAFLTLVGLVGLVLLATMGVQSIPTSEFRRRLNQQLTGWQLGGAIPFTGTTTIATTDITAPSSLQGLQVGMTITGAGIPANTIITAVDSALHKVTINNAATASAAGVALVANFFGPNSSARVRLYAAPFSGSLDPSPSDFTEATFDTYAYQPVQTYTGPYSNTDGSAEVSLGDYGWVLFANPTISNTIYGYWVEYVDLYSGATVVAFWEDFPSPLPMEEIGNAVVVTIPTTLPDPGAAVTP